MSYGPVRIERSHRKTPVGGKYDVDYRSSSTVSLHFQNSLKNDASGFTFDQPFGQSPKCYLFIVTFDFPSFISKDIFKHRKISEATWGMIKILNPMKISRNKWHLVVQPNRCSRLRLSHPLTEAWHVLE